MNKKFGKLCRLLAKSTYRSALKYGVAASIEHEQVIKSLEIGSLIDVGANVGQFSVLSRHLHPNAKIHAFEPLEEAANNYRKVFRNDQNTTLHQLALSDSPGEKLIHVSERPDSSSLLPISSNQSYIFPGTDEKETRRIITVLGDDVLSTVNLPAPILIKLDVQGYELAALRGMPQLLRRASYVYAELSFVELYLGQPLAADVINWLSRQNFELSGIYNLSTESTGLTVQADALFRNKGPGS